MIDHMLRAACCRCRCLRARTDTTEITYEVREGAQIEPAPHYCTVARLGAPRIVRASELPYGRHSRCGSRSVTSALVWAYRGLYERVRRLAGAAVRS